MALFFFFFFNLGAVPFLFPPHPHPSARVSVTQSHCLITAEGQRNINDFLMRISSSKQDLNGCWKNFWSLRITKKYLTSCARQLMGRKAFFSADGCPDGLWRIQLSARLRAAVYYSDFAQQIKSSKMRLYPTETIIWYILKYPVLDISRGKWNLSLFS